MKPPLLHKGSARARKKYIEHALALAGLLVRHGRGYRAVT
jgi:hypothetical protein